MFLEILLTLPILPVGMLVFRMSTKISKLNRENFGLLKEVDSLKLKVESFEVQNSYLLNKISEHEKVSFSEVQKRSRYEAENSLLKVQIRDLSESHEKSLEQWKKDIAKYTNDLIDKKSSLFEKSLEEGVLQNLKSDIDKFKSDVNIVFKSNSEDQGKLKEMLDQRTRDFLSAKDHIMSQAENLSKIFKKDYKFQGNWGEMVLEKVLEDSGLKKDVHYKVQPSMRSEAGDLLKPDVIIYLPKNRHIIVDSKVSLVYFEKFCSEEEISKKSQYKKQFIQNVRNQIEDLSAKHYQSVHGVNSPEFVLMFIPIEMAYSLISEDELHSYAWNQKKVALVSVSPSKSSSGKTSSMLVMASVGSASMICCSQLSGSPSTSESSVVSKSTLWMVPLSPSVTEAAGAVSSLK